MRVRALQEATLLTYLGESTQQVACSLLSITISFLSFISSSIFHYTFTLCVYVLTFASIFNSVTFVIIVSFYVLSIPQLYIIFTIHCIFPSAFESEHSHLITWLSSCPVGIFPRSHLTIAKMEIINKMSPLKWTNLKSTHIKKEEKKEKARKFKFENVKLKGN